MRTVLLLLVLLSACAGDPQGCRLEKLAELPVRLEGSVPVLAVEINGKPASLVLDTGSDSTVLNREAARRLGVPEGTARTVQGAGGVAAVSLTRMDRLTFGGIVIPGTRALLSESPRPPYDGLLGLDVLVGFELDLDVPAGRATFYRARGCPTAVPDWAAEVVRLPTQTQAGSGHMFVPVEVDGEPLRGMLDSGASRTALSVQAAEDVRINQRRLRQLPGFRGQAVNAEGVVVRTQIFRTLKVGTDVLERPEMVIVDLPPFAGDLLIGSDYIATRRIWFNFLVGRVFVRR